jgi:hypothetical protein
MNRQEALDWLNYRLDLESAMKRNNHFTETDLQFFTYFIRDQTGKYIDRNDLINSIKFHSESCMRWVERLINYLIYKHSIEVVVANSGQFMIDLSSGISGDSLKVLKYK